jgi:nuclear pore complex protein Nup62
VQVKEFGRQAGEVREWDRVLVENGNQISRLYSQIISAEEANKAVEDSLSYIESQQGELGNLLDGYEAQANEMFDGAGGRGVGLDFGPADGEREKAYSLAETLHSQLDTLSRSLTSMIDEVNSLSANSTAVPPLSTSILDPSADSSGAAPTAGAAAEEDPVSQIAQILNAHLTSLQWIDGAAGGMKDKVVELERKMVEVNGGGRNMGGTGRRLVESGGGLGRSQQGSASGRYGMGRR